MDFAIILHIMMKSQCVQCSLGTFCLNEGLVPIVTKERHLKRGEVLHRVNDDFKHLYAIQRGALKTYEIDSMGNEIIHGLYLKNEIYGYEGIYKNHYVFGASALAETVICEISYQGFLDFLRLKPDFLHRALYLMSQQLTASVYLKSITAQQRIAAFLVDLSARLSINLLEPGFLLPMTYQDIGNYLGMATETVSRILSLFKRNQIISIHNKYIRLLSIEKLKV